MKEGPALDDGWQEHHQAEDSEDQESGGHGEGSAAPARHEWRGELTMVSSYNQEIAGAPLPRAWLRQRTRHWRGDQ